jgi:hypothetical protein
VAPVVQVRSDMQEDWSRLILQERSTILTHSFLQVQHQEHQVSVELVVLVDMEVPEVLVVSA